MARKRTEFVGPGGLLSMLETSFLAQVEDPESRTSWVLLIDPSKGVHYNPMHRQGELRLEVEAKRPRGGLAFLFGYREARVTVGVSGENEIRVTTFSMREKRIVELGKYRVETEAQVFAAFPHALRDVSNALAMQLG